MTVYRLSLIALVTLNTSLSPAVADALSRCVSLEFQKLEQAQTFQSTGRVTCPPGEVVGFPPRSLLHNREGIHRYAAPDGYVIVSDGERMPQAIDVSSQGGQIGALEISSDQREVFVPISCQGSPAKQGEAWQEVRLEGFIQKPVSTSEHKSILRSCAAQN